VPGPNTPDPRRPALPDADDAFSTAGRRVSNGPMRPARRHEREAGRQFIVIGERD